MLVLWLVNSELPELSVIKGKKENTSGGWLKENSIKLSREKMYKLHIVSPSEMFSKRNTYKGEKIVYHTFDNKSIKMMTDYFKELLSNLKPALVHIYGTEYKHTLAMVNACIEKKIKFVITIQGVISVISEHMYANLPPEVISGKTIRNILKRDSVKMLKKQFYKRGLLEIKAIKNSSYIIGRTKWDKYYSLFYNNKIKYFHLDETMRGGFYNNVWNQQEIEKHSIYISQSNYPVKGIHFLIEAVKELVLYFPDIKVYVSGNSRLSKNSFKNKILRTKYDKYIFKLLRKYDLQDNFIFIGNLSEKEVISKMLKANLLVSSSTIENSSNAISEAMLIGLPVVASNVGGTSSIIDDEINGLLYRHDEKGMLIEKISKIFNDDKLVYKISRNSRNIALKRHDIESNYQELLNIYTNIIGGNFNE